MAYSMAMSFGKKIPLEKAIGTTHSDIINVQSCSNYHGIFFHAQVVKTCVGVGASLQVKLQESSDGNTWEDVFDSGVIPVAQLSPGKNLIKKECPQKQKEFYRLQYTVAGAALTGGELFAVFCDAIDMR